MACEITQNSNFSIRYRDEDAYTVGGKQIHKTSTDLQASWTRGQMAPNYKKLCVKLVCITMKTNYLSYTSDSSSSPMLLYSRAKTVLVYSEIRFINTLLKFQGNKNHSTWMGQQWGIWKTI